MSAPRDAPDMCKDHDSPNHAYILRTIQRLAGPEPRVLDYGCGTGAFIALARSQGIEAWGTDTYAGQYQAWLATLAGNAQPYVRQSSGRVPWPDASFDAVVCNQVFEHMAWADVQVTIAEIARVLRPGGSFLALFPTSDVWWEGHVGVYFLPRLASWPRVLRPYLRACAHIGMGYHRGNRSARQWADDVVRQWPYDISHHHMHDVRALWRVTFGAAPVSLAADYMRYRLPWARSLPDPLLSWVCHKRAGRVLAVSRPAGVQATVATAPALRQPAA